MMPGLRAVSSPSNKLISSASVLCAPNSLLNGHFFGGSVNVFSSIFFSVPADREASNARGA